MLKLAFHFFSLRFQIGRFDLKGRFVDGPSQVAIQQSVLHVGQFRLAFGQHFPSHRRGGTDVFECRLDGLAIPIGRDWVRKANPFEFLNDGLLDVGLAPAHLRMALVGMVVAAAVVYVVVATAVVKLAADQLAGHGEVAARAAEDAA